MSVKTFKPGEWAYHPKIKLQTFKDQFRVELWDWDGNLDEVKIYNYNSVHNFELDMMDETSSYYASTMVEWVHSSKEYKASYNPDPFTTYSFGILH